MSRQVPQDQALTDVDRHYLRQLGAHGMALEARLDQEFPPDPDALAVFETAERKAAAELNGAGLTASDQQNLADENDRLRAELAALKGGAATEPPEDYSGWSKAELEAEIDRVNEVDSEAGLVKGKVDDMKAALAAYFAE